MIPADEKLIAEIKAKFLTIGKMAAALNQAAVWFKGYADMYYKQGKTEKGHKNEFRANFLYSKCPDLPPRSYFFSCQCGEKYTLITSHTPGITMDCISCGATLKPISYQSSPTSPSTTQIIRLTPTTPTYTINPA